MGSVDLGRVNVLERRMLCPAYLSILVDGDSSNRTLTVSWGTDGMSVGRGDRLMNRSPSQENRSFCVEYKGSWKRDGPYGLSFWLEICRRVS